MVKTKDVNEEGRGGPRQERLEEALESRAERSGSGVIREREFRLVLLSMAGSWGRVASKLESGEQS